MKQCQSIEVTLDTNIFAKKQTIEQRSIRYESLFVLFTINEIEINIVHLAERSDYHLQYYRTTKTRDYW